MRGLGPIWEKHWRVGVAVAHTYVPQHFYHEFESSISHIVLGEISFILERMRFNVEELNYSIIKFTIWNFPKVKFSSPYIKYICDNLPLPHLNNSVSSNFQPRVILFDIYLWFRAFLSNYAKNLYLVHSVLFSFIQPTLVLFNPIWSYFVHFGLIQYTSIRSSPIRSILVLFSPFWFGCIQSTSVLFSLL